MKPKGQKDDFSPGWLEEVLARVEEERGEHIQSRWVIYETTPSRSYRVGDGHGGSEIEWSSPKDVRINMTFPTKEEAQSFMDKHEPDEGNTLWIKEEKLYRKLTENWY